MNHALAARRIADTINRHGTEVVITKGVDNQQVFTPDGSVPKAVVIVNETQLYTMLQIEGEPSEKKPTGFQFPAEMAGLIGKGNLLACPAGTYRADMVHSVPFNGVIFYVGVLAYEV